MTVFVLSATPADNGATFLSPRPSPPRKVAPNGGQMMKPWDQLTREIGESTMDFSCRKICAMSDWHHNHAGEEGRIYAEARRIALRENDDEEARNYISSKMNELYRADPLVYVQAAE